MNRSICLLLNNWLTFWINIINQPLSAWWDIILRWSVRYPYATRHSDGTVYLSRRLGYKRLNNHTKFKWPHHLLWRCIRNLIFFEASRGYPNQVCGLVRLCLISTRLGLPFLTSRVRFGIKQNCRWSPLSNVLLLIESIITAADWLIDTTPLTRQKSRKNTRATRFYSRLAIKSRFSSLGWENGASQAGVQKDPLLTIGPWLCTLNGFVCIHAI